MDMVNYIKIFNKLRVLLVAIVLIVGNKCLGQTTVTVGGGASVTCPATPTATWTTPPVGVTFSNWSRGSGVNCATASTALSGSGFNTASAAASFTANKYYSVTITADAVTTFTLSSITWLTAVSSGGCNFDVQYSNNGGAVTSFGVSGNSTTTNTFNGSVSVSAGTSIVLYLIPWGTGASGTTVRFVNGSTFTLTATSNSPTLTLSPTTLTGFTYIFGNGPSASQSSNLSGTNLTGFPGNITVTGTTNYEVSSDNITFGATASIPYTSATLASTPVYIRLKAGLAVGNYDLETVSNAGGGATTKNITCSGNVTTATISLSVTTLSGFIYVVSNGPSSTQTFTCSGSSLSANIILTAPTDYEISLSAGSGFGSSLTLTQTSGSVASTTIYVRLKSGLAVGNYNSETISATSTGATSQNITCNGTVVLATTVFGAGDIAIVGMCVDMNGCSGSTTVSEDELSFVSFEDITPGTTIDITDNGFERVGCNSNTWGNTEGVIRLTRTTSTVPKGTIITLRIIDQSIFTPLQPDGNWTVSYPNSGFGNFNMNSNDEQVYIMQGGTWNKGTSGNHDATYTGGTLMFGINTYTAWNCNIDLTTRGNLPLALKCFSILPGIAAKHIKYTGPVTAASQKDWVDRLNSPSNWTGTNTCAAYIAGGLDYGGSPQTYSIVSSGFNSGYWTGATNSDWYDCNNWQNYKIPDSLANVTIDNVTNDPVIGASPALYPNGAVCNDLSITSTAGSGVLTLNNSLSYLSIKGNIINNGVITATNGLTDLRSVNAQTFSGTGTTGFYNLRLNNTNASGISLTKDVSVSNLLTFTNGMLNTGTNKLIITNTTVPTISGYTTSKFINGNLRHFIGSNTSTYVFPIGDGMTSANYKRIDLLNNNLAGVNYIDAYVNSVTETSPNDDATFATAAQSQNGSSLFYIMENAAWDLTPDAAPTGNSYGVRLYTANTGLTSADDNSFCPVKRPSASVTYADWVSLESSTTIPAAGAAGRIYNAGAGYAERLGYTSFSKHAIAKSSGPLPIELLTFTAKYNGTNAVDLKWATATEINNDYFTIERSFDAFSFKPILVVDGAGNSSVILTYSDIDKNPNKGLNYYRLKQTDFNGKTSYSQIVSVDVQSTFVASIYPNPVISELHIKISADIKESANFEIINLQGVTLDKTRVQISEEGIVSIDLQSYAAGAYILKTTIGNETKQTLFIKQ